MPLDFAVLFSLFIGLGLVAGPLAGTIRGSEFSLMGIGSSA
jgi:hypothetical protein